MGVGDTRFMPFMRAVHVYVSMAAVLVMTFLAVSGIIVNHGDWFSPGEAAPQVRVASFPADIPLEAGAQAAIEAHLRAAHLVAGDLTAFEPGDDQVRLAFRRPGRSDDVVIRRDTRQVEISTEAGGPVAVLADLHRVKPSRTAWRWLMDAAAVALVVCTVSGVAVCASLGRRRRAWGFVVLGVFGAATAVVAAWACL